MCVEGADVDSGRWGGVLVTPLLTAGGVLVRQGRGGQGTVPLRGHNSGSGSRQQICPLSRCLCSADPTLTLAQVSPLAPPTQPAPPVLKEQ